MPSFSAISLPNLNPPEVQHYMVEHIVKNEDSRMIHSIRLWAFSGRSPRSQTEADYDTWCSGVELLLKDPAYGTVQDGDELYAKFMDTSKMQEKSHLHIYNGYRLL